MHNMRRHLNLLSTSFALICILFALPACSRQSSAERHLKDGNGYFEAGQYDSAEIEYRNVLQVEPLNPQAIARLGVIYFDQGSLDKAIPFLRKGHELQPDNAELLLRLTETHLASGEVALARDEARAMLIKNPADAEAPVLLVQAAVSAKDTSDARQTLLGLPPAAANGAPVLLALGTLESREHHVVEAKALFERALAIDPKSSAANVALGGLLWRQKDIPGADEALSAAAKLAPVRSPRHLQYAQFKLQAGDPEAAKRLLEDTNREAPDYLPAWLLLAEIDATQKKFVEAQSILGKVLQRDPKNPEGLFMNARIDIGTGDVSKAVAEMEKMQKVYPKSARVDFQLAQAYLAAQDMNKAVGSLNQALALSPDYLEAEVLLAETDIKMGNYSAVLIAMKRLIQKHPDFLQGWLLFADANRGLGNYNDALAVYRQLDTSFPKNAETSLLKGAVLLQQNKRDEARQSFTRALEISPGYLVAVEQLIDMDLAEKRYEPALQLARTEVERSPTLALPQLLLAKVLTAQKDTPTAEAALLKAIELQPNAPTGYFLLAQLYIGTNRQDAALADLKQVIAKNPKEIRALMTMGILYQQQKNYVSARDTYEQLLSVNPKFTPALNNLAYLYSEEFNQLDKALEMAQRARELAPDEPHLADTLGWILFKRHQYTWALNLLQASAARLPAVADVQFHLGMTYYMMGQEDLARPLLEKALQLNQGFTGNEEARQCLSILAMDVGSQATEGLPALEKTLAARPQDPVALARLASVYEREGSDDKAISAYKAALEANPASPNATMNLVRVYSAHDETKKALELAEAAHKQQPDDPTIAHALGTLAFKTGDFVRANTLLQGAALVQPDNPGLLYDLAKAQYSVGRVPEAETAMRHAAQSDLPRLEAIEAKRFLEMTTLYANPAKAESASSRVDEIIKSEAGYVPALMVLAEIDEAKNDSGAASKLYETVIEEYPDFAPANLRLAAIYSRDPEKDQRTLERAAKAATVFRDDAGLSKIMGVVLFREKDYLNAANKLQESVRQDGSDPETFFYLGMAQLKLNKRAEGRTALQQALDLHLTGDLEKEAREALVDSKSG